MTTLDTFPAIVSVDDHIVEPPELWSSRLPKDLRERGPRVQRERLPEKLVYEGPSDQALPRKDGGAVWGDVWHYEDVVVPLDKTVTAVSFDPSEVDVTPTTYDDIRPGCFQRDARIADMDINHVDVSICYPNTFVRFAGQRFLAAKDKDLALLCVQAYNDFLIEEWTGADNRLLPAAIVPMWDPALAASEVRRMAAMGSKLITFSELPSALGEPSIHSGYWDPLIQACAETGTVISMHIGSGSKQFTTSPDAPLSLIGILSFTSAAMSLVDWLVSGHLARFPDLRIAFAECQIGWIPYVLQRADKHVITSGWGVASEVRDALKHELPSTYFKNQVFVSFFDDEHGLRSLDEIGTDNVCFETDYPHADSTWPNSLIRAKELCADLDDTVTQKIMRDNGLRMVGLG